MWIICISKIGFYSMSTTVLRCDVTKTLFRVSIINTQIFVQFFEQQAFRKPIVLAGGEPALGIAALRALVVQGGNCLTPGPNTVLTALPWTPHQDNRLCSASREKQTACHLIGISGAGIKILLSTFYCHAYSISQNGLNKQRGFPLPSPFSLVLVG